METARYFKMFSARKWVILIVALVTTGVVVLLNMLGTPSYTATAKLRIVPFGTNAPDYGSFVYFDRLASTYSELLGSDVVTEEARFRLGLDELPDYMIETIPQTELMRLAVTDEDPALAQSVANALATILVEQNERLFAGAVGDIRQTLEAELNQLQVEIDALVAEQALLESEIPRNNARLAEVTGQVTSRQQRFNLLSNNYNQAIVSQSNQANAITIVQNATLPDEPSSPSTARMAVLGGALGLLAGLALAFLLEMFNPRLHTERQIETITGTKLTGRIPNIRRRFRRNVYLGDIFGAEAFRRLSASLGSTLERSRRNQVILVTSSIPGEGKSTISANLAMAMARGQRTVALVDCDMRRPTQHTLFQV
ncbi:MAG: P-loop NTPase, partial [Blastochloris sp.]|nr:P-loop NTPase [Blastochloris sp.]